MTLLKYWVTSVYYFLYRGFKKLRLWLWITFTPEGKQSAWIYTKAVQTSKKDVKQRIAVKHATSRLLVKKGGIITDESFSIDQPTNKEDQ